MRNTSTKILGSFHLPISNFQIAFGVGIDFNIANKTVNSIHIWIEGVNYEHERLRELLTNVTIRYPGLENVIRTRKLVMYIDTSSNEKNSIKTLIVDKKEVTSGLFE